MAGERQGGPGGVGGADACGLAYWVRVDARAGTGPCPRGQEGRPACLGWRPAGAVCQSRAHSAHSTRTRTDALHHVICRGPCGPPGMTSAAPSPRPANPTTAPGRCYVCTRISSLGGALLAVGTEQTQPAIRMRLRRGLAALLWTQRPRQCRHHACSARDEQARAACESMLGR